MVRNALLFLAGILNSLTIRIDCREDESARMAYEGSIVRRKGQSCDEENSQGNNEYSQESYRFLEFRVHLVP